jgi:hypothetical protein
VGLGYHGLGAEVAQSVEHSTENAGVPSSILGLGTSVLTILNSAVSGSGSVVEHLLAKEKVVGSNPIFRSTFLGFKRRPRGEP